jgi:hypothetical protein
MLAFAFLLLMQPATLGQDSPLTTAVKPPRVFERQFPVSSKPLVAPPGFGPAPTKTPEPAAVATAGGLPLLREAQMAPDAPLERRTMVEDGALQVVFGERAIFLLSPDDGEPRLSDIQQGRLEIAHPPGAVRETFAAPPKGRLAAALDGSAEKGSSYLKVWNGTDKPIAYRAQAMVLRAGKILPLAAPVCAVMPGETRTQSWPSAIAAVVLSRFTPPEADAITHAGCG